MNNFIENTGMRVIPTLISLFALVWFLIPFAKGIINIGNCTGATISLIMLLISLFFSRFSDFVKRSWDTAAGKIVISSALALITVCILTAAIISVFMIREMNDLPKNDNVTLVVLGCQVKGTQPSNMLKSRLDTAYEYLSVHDSVNVVVSGGKGDDELISEAQCMKEYLLKKGIAPDRIFMEDKSVNTEENLKFSLELIEEHGLNNNITIVTDGFHQLRADIIAKRFDADSNNISAPTKWYLLPTYWLREWFGNMYFMLSE